jgi:predicted NUDIX family NTP pyrophosphohydrolase
MALSPANQDIYYYANDTRTKSYTVTDGDGAAVDLSGDTITLTIRKKKGGTVVATLSTASEITISGASSNVVNIAFNNDLDERSYYYDLYNNTDDETIMYGLLIVTGEVHA